MGNMDSIELAIRVHNERRDRAIGRALKAISERDYGAAIGALMEASGHEDVMVELSFQMEVGMSEGGDE